MWFWPAEDGPILPVGVPGPMPGPAPGTGCPGPTAPPPPVGADWNPPLDAISSLDVASGGAKELTREQLRRSLCDSALYCSLLTLHDCPHQETKDNCGVWRRNIGYFLKNTFSMFLYNIFVFFVKFFCFVFRAIFFKYKSKKQQTGWAATHENYKKNYKSIVHVV